MLRDLLIFHYKIDLVATAGRAVGAEACPGAGFRIDLKTGGFVVVKGASEAVVVVGGQIVER